MSTSKEIEVYSGKFIDITKIKPEDIDIHDIAHSLSMLCRFGGHCNKFYSVAEHSIHVAHTLQEAYSREQALAGLLHDATEAYLCDVPRPIKKMLPQYKKMEDKIWEAIENRFFLLAEHKIIKHADNYLLKSEAQCLMQTGGKDWTDVGELGVFKDYELLDVSMPLDSLSAESLFIKTFRELIC